MSVSMVTATYQSWDWSAVSETPTVRNITELERDPLLAVAEVVVLAVILLLALTGNGLVLVVLLKRRQHQSPIHQFMLNLCVADLVVALFQVTKRHTALYSARIGAIIKAPQQYLLRFEAVYGSTRQDSPFSSLLMINCVKCELQE